MPSTVLLVGLLACATVLALRAILPWAGGLAVLAVLAFVALRTAVVSPILRLRDDIAGIASAESPWSSRRSRVSEIERITRVLSSDNDLNGRSSGIPSRRPTLPMGVSLIAVMALVFGWLVAGVASAGNGRGSDEQAITEQSRHDVEAAAQQLGRTLGDGLAQLQGVAATAGAAGGGPGGVIDSFYSQQRLFRSVYLLDPAGAVTGAAGSAPRGSAPANPLAPPHLRQLNSTGPEPIVVASVPMPEAAGTVVAEFDPRAVNEVLRRSAVATLVADTEHRTILSSSGYQAFDKLDDPTLRDVASTAAQQFQPAVTLAEHDGRLLAVAAQPVDTAGPAASLQWVLVQDQRGSATFSQTYDQRVFLVVVGATGGITLLVLAWMVVVAVQPLRRLAAHIEEATTGRAPVQRLDEVGAIAAGINSYLFPRPAAPSPSSHQLVQSGS